jgi:hypothetical protein
MSLLTHLKGWYNVQPVALKDHFMGQVNTLILLLIKDKSSEKAMRTLSTRWKIQLNKKLLGLIKE